MRVCVFAGGGVCALVGLIVFVFVCVPVSLCVCVCSVARLFGWLIVCACMFVCGMLSCKCVCLVVCVRVFGRLFVCLKTYWFVCVCVFVCVVVWLCACV